MRTYLCLLTAVLLSLCSNEAQGQKRELRPQWMRQVPVSSSPYVEFVKVYTPARATVADELGRLVVNLPSDWNVSSEISDVQVTETVVNGRRTSESSRLTGTIKTTAQGMPVSIRCVREDGYTEGSGRWSLYQVAKSDRAVFEECITTEEYGAGAAVMSIIPGCGQFYKGDPLKGTLFLGGCAAGAVGTVFIEMQRQAYVSQIGQTHDINVIRQLDARQKNLGIARNVCIGATAALYVWNIVDSALAPGAKKIVFTGSSLRYNF